MLIPLELFVCSIIIINYMTREIRLLKLWGAGRILLVSSVIFLFLSLNLSAQNCSVNAGVPQTICANQQLFLQGGSSGLIAAPVTWTQIGGPAATIVAPTTLNTEVTNLIAGNTYTFRIYTTCQDGALTYQDVTHTVNAISIASAGTDATYCPGGNVGSLAASTPGVGETGTWTGSGSAGVTVNDPNNPTSTITLSGSSSGSATLRWTITNPNGCSSYDEVVITNRGGITPVSAGPDQVLNSCYSSTYSTTLAGSYDGTGIDGQTGVWSIISGPSIPVFGNVNAHNSSVSNLVQGTYVLRWTVSGPCASGFDEMKITVPPPTGDITDASISGGDQAFCDATTTSTVLYGSIPQYAGETVTWALQSQSGGGAVTITNPNSPVTSITGLSSPNSYTFIYTIENGVAACTNSATVQVSYLPDAPTLSITTTDPILLTCGVSSTSIAFTAGGTGTTQYRFLSGPGIGSPSPWSNVAGSPLSITGLTGVGTYVVQMQRFSTVGAAAACGAVYDEISIVTSLATQAANAGTDQKLDCNITSTKLIGNEPSVGQGTWSQVSGPIVIILSDPHAWELDIDGLTSEGLYVFRWVISGGPNCTPSQDDVEVRTANLVPSSKSAGANQTVCYNTPLYLNATAKDFAYEISTWSVTPSTGVVFSDIHSPTATITGLAANTSYTFTWTIQNGCGTATSSMLVDVINTVGPTASNAGADQCLVNGTTSVTLAGNNPSVGTGTWTQISALPGTITSPNQYNTTVTGMTDGTYEFQWSVASGGCQPNIDRVIITIDNAIQVFTAGVDQQICGTSATLTTSLGANPTVGTGIWTQVSGNAATITTPNNYTTTITGINGTDLVSGTYVFRYTITNGGCSASDDVTIYLSTPPSTANIALNELDVCGSSSASLQADIITSGTGLWTIVSGPNTPTFSAQNSASTNVSGLITGNYVFRWTVSGGPFCPTSNDVISVNVTLAANAGSNQSYCEAVSSVNLTGTTASTGNWSQVGTSPSIATITATGTNTAIASNLVPGVYTFEYTISATGCTTTDQMTVTLYAPPSTASAGADQNLCDASSFVMAATSPGSGTGAWTILSRPAGDTGTFNTPSSPTATYTPVGNKYGIYVFQWTVSNGSCSNTDQVRVTNYQPPSAADPGTNQTGVCTSYATMAATSPAIGLGTWTTDGVVPPGATPVITNPTSATTTITNLIPDTYPATYTFRWTVANGSPTCTSNSATMTVQVLEPVITANAGPDQNLCNEGISFILDGNNVSPGTGAWSLVSGPGPVPTFNPNAEDPVVTNITNGTYVFRYTSTLASSGCSTTDDVTIINYQQPIAAAGDNQSICQFSSLNLNATPAAVGIGTWTTISKPGTLEPIFASNHQATTAVTGTEVGTYVFRWTVTNGTCTHSDDVQVIINPLPSTANAGADQSICSPASTATFAGNTPTGGSSGLWEFVSGPNTPSITTPSSPTSGVTGLITGIYVFRWKHYIGACETTDDVQIQVYAPTTTADAGIDQISCNENTFTLVGNVPLNANETVQWVYYSGPSGAPSVPVITSPNATTTTVTGVTTGTYQFRYRIISGTCTYTEDIVAIENIPVANAGADQTGSTTCGKVTVTLQGNNPAPSTGSWTIENGVGGSFANSSLFNTTFTGVAGNTYTLRWTIAPFVGASVPCVAGSYDEMSVKLNISGTVNNPGNQTVCNGGAVSAINFSGTATSYEWTNNNTNINLAASGTGNIAGFNAANSTDAPITATIIVTPKYDNGGGVICTGTSETFTITVNPTPTVISASTKTVCDNSNVNYTPVSATSGTTFNWTASNTAGTVTGFTVSGSGPINDILDNTGASLGQVTYVITPTANGCPGTPLNLVVSVNPTPDVIATPVTTNLCSGSATSIALTTNVTSPAVSYTWTAATISGTASYTTSGSGSTISQIITNTSNASATVRYTITPAIGACTGASATVDINVNPSGQVTLTPSSNQALCVGDNTVQVDFTTTRIDGTTTYAWTNSNPNIGLPASGSGTSNLASFVTTNTGTTPITGTIVVTPTYTNNTISCTGPTKSFTITVNPRPIVANQTTSTCSDVATGFTLPAGTGAAANRFNITNINLNGLTASAGSPATGNNLLANVISNDAFTNTTGASVDVVYTITPVISSTGCTGNPFTVTVTVNPEPVVANQAPAAICSRSASGFTLPAGTGATPATTFNITNISNGGLTASAGSPATGTGLAANVIADDAWINTTGADVNVVYTVVPRSAGSCSGNPFTVTLTIRSEPVVTNGLTQALCPDASFNATASRTLTTTPNMAGTTFSWGAPVLTGGMTYTDHGTTGSTIIDDYHNATSAAQTATYTVTPTSSLGCVGQTRNVVITVNSRPVVANQTTSICSDVANGFTLPAGTSVAATSFNIASINNNGLTASAGSPAIGNGLAANVLSDDAYTNITASPADVIYTVVPVSAAGCTGDAFTVTVTINPEPVVANQTPAAICSRGATGFTLPAGTSVAATSFNITNINSNGLVAFGGSPATGAGLAANVISDDAWTNTTTASVNVVYTVVPVSAAGCAGSSFTVTLQVNPEPVVSSASTKSICTGDNVNYTPTSALAGTTYTWTASNTVGTVTGFSTSGSGPITDVLTNAGSADGQVTYVITPQSSSLCNGLNFSLVVTVINCNPKIGVAKQLVSMDNNGDGTYEALFNIRVQNYGNLDLDNIQVTENLVSVFGASNYAVLGLSSTSFDVNTAFTGNTTGNGHYLLNNSGTTNRLEVGASTDIHLRVKLLSTGSWNNTVTASSTTGSVSDVSQNGSDPDTDGDGDPTNNNVVTPVNTACSPIMTVSVADGAMCYPTATTFQLVTTASNVSSFTWTTDGTGTFNNATVEDPIYTPSASDVQDGQVRLKVVAKSGGICPNVEDEMILIIWTPPTVNAGPDATVCANSIYTITGATATNFSGLLWSTSGTGTFNSTNTLDPTYTPSGADITAGFVDLTLIAYKDPATVNTCTNQSDVMRLTFTTAPTVDAGVDATICSTTATKTMAATAANYTSLLWTTSGTGTFNSNTIEDPIYTPSTADRATGQVQLTLTATKTGCSSVSDYMVLNMWTAPTANAGPDASICSGDSFVLTGATASSYASIAWTVTAGTGTFNNANALNPTFTPTSTGTITLRLTATRLDASCSDAIDDITLTVSQTPTLTASSITTTGCTGSTGSVVLTSSDGSTVTLNGTTQASGTTFSGLAAGSYTASSNGTCAATTSFNILNSNSTLTGMVTSHTNVDCYGNSTGAITVAASGGTAPYTYSLNGGAGQGSGTFGSLAAGEYGVRITDAGGCTYTVSFDIDQPTPLVLSLASKTNVLCNGDATGSAIVIASGGMPGYTYVVTAGPNSPTVSGNVITGMVAGNYTVRVTDGNSCTSTLSVVISQPASSLDITSTAAVLTNPGCNGAATGSINITVTGGTSPYSYAWSNGTNAADPSELVAGSYTVVVTDANGCTISGGPYVLTNPSAVTLTAGSISNTTCNASTGSATLTGSVAGTVSLNGGAGIASPATFSNLSAGYYTATFTATTGGCTAATSFNIINTNSTLAGSVTALTNVSCNGGSTGSATVTASGGTAPYTYRLNGVLQGSNSFSSLSAGSYTVLITDANTCTYTVSFDINQPTSLVLSKTSQTNVSCQGLSDGSIILVGSGGTTGYSYSIVSQPVGGTATISGNVVSGMKAGAYALRVTDANSCTADLPVTITQSVCTPVAVNDNIVTAEDIAVSGNVITNDTDPNGLSLTVSQFVIGGTTYAAGNTATITNVGTLVVNSNGTYTYTPAANYNGPVPTVTYTITNGTNTATAELSITVTPVDDIPDAVDDGAYTTAEDVAYTGTVAGNDVLSGDGGNVWSLVTAPSNGTVVIELDGKFTYTPASNYTGADSFVYKLCDADGDCDNATVSFTVSSVNDTPLAVDDYIPTQEDTPVTISVLTNDNFGGDGPSATAITIVTNATNGIAVVNDNGTANNPTDDYIVYTPNADFNGNDSFTYRICDSGGDCSTATVLVNVNPVNDNPLAVADVVSVTEDNVLNGDLGLNDTRSGDGGNVWSLVTGPLHGTVIVHLDGTYTYTPSSDYNGADSFTYRLCDGDGSCSSATVSITVNPANDAPVANNDIATTPEDTAKTGNVLTNDTDTEGTALSVTQFIVDGDATVYTAGQTATITNVGTITIAGTGVYTFTPAANYHGPVPVITYTNSDGSLTDTATLTITVTPVIDVPIAVADSYPTVTEDTSFSGNLGANDTQSGDGGNVWNIVTPPLHGSVIVNLDGTFTYTPDADYTGTDSFTYKLCDTDNDCSSATVSLTVLPVNDPPVISDVPKSGTEDSDITFASVDFISKYTDTENDPMTQIRIVSLPANGTLKISGVPVTAGDIISVANIANLTFTPNANWNGSTSFDWNGYDGNLYAVINEQVNLTVTPVNDPPVAGVATMISQLNPGGTNTVQVYANNFSGTDIDGTISSIRITSMPTNATSITVDGIIYSAIPGGGINVTTNTTGQPLFSIAIDPVDGAVTSVLSYDVIDNEGLASLNAGTVTVPFNGLSLAGTLYNDGNGLSDNLVNGTGTNLGGNAWMNLVDMFNKVVASKAIAANGTYTFTEIDGLQVNTGYRLILTNSLKTVGSTLSVASYPAGWVSTGENIGAGAGNDGTIDGILSVNTNSGSLSGANFGVSGSMTLYAGADAAICSTGTYTLAGSATNYNTVLWTTNGTGTFSNPSVLTPVYTPSAADIATREVQLTLTVTGSGSVGTLSDMMVLTIWPAATAYAGIDQSVCRGDVYQVLDASVSNAGSVLWTKNPAATGTLSGVNTLTPVYSPGIGETGIITLTLTVTPNGGGACGTVSDSKTLTITDPPTVNVGPDINNCSLGIQTITATAANYSSLEWSTSGTGTFSSINALTTTYTPSVADINYAQVTLRLTARGNGSCASVFDELVLKVWRNTSAYAGIDVAVCSGESYQVLDAEATDYVGIVWTHNGTGSLANATTLSPTYTPGPGESGTVTLTMTVIPEGSGTCPNYTDQKDIVIAGAPVVNCPAGGPFVFSNTPGVCGYVVTNTSLDATASGCNGNVTLTHDFGWGNPYSLKGATFPVGTTNVVWSAVDGNGNVSTCSTTIVVNDTEAPVFTNCASGTTFTVGLFHDVCKGGAIWSIPVVNDNCAVVSLVQTKGPLQGTLIDPGLYQIEYTATDAAGNISTCSFSIHVIDTQNPILVCPPNTIQETDPGKCSWKSPSNSLSVMLARSSCPSALIWNVVNPDGTTAFGIGDISGYNFFKGVSTVTYTSQISCSFTVTVVDREAPVLTTPDDIVKTTVNGACSASINMVQPEYADNCSTVPSVATYRVFNPDNSVSGPYTGNSSYMFKAGISRVEWTILDSSGNSATTMYNVTVTPDGSSLNPMAGTNETICEGSIYTLSNSNAMNYSNLLWSSSGSGKFSNRTILHPVYTPSLADILNGEVELTLTASSACASSSSSLTITISRQATVRAGYSASVSICSGDQIELVGATQSNTVSIHWSSSGSGSFSDPSILNPVYTPDDADFVNGGVTLTLTGTPESPCGEVSDAIFLNLIKQSTANAGPDAGICQDEIYQLTGAGATDQSSVLWKTSGTGIFNNAKSVNPTYYPSAADIINGKVYLTLNSIGISPCSTVDDEMELTISKLPVIDAGEDQIACPGEQVQVSTAKAQYYSNTQWSTTGKGQILNPGTLQPVYIPAEGETGLIELVLTASGLNYCSDDKSSDTMVIDYQQELIVDAGGADTIFYNRTALLSSHVIQGSGSYIFKWMPADLLTNANSSQTETIPLTSDTKFTVLITDVFTGCQATDSVAIVVNNVIEDLINIRNGLSPNGDGNNDVWWIDGIEKFPENKVKIFNRWGDKVRDLENYDNTNVYWDGKNNDGQRLPDGTYYYVLEIKNLESFTGWIQLRSSY